MLGVLWRRRQWRLLSNLIDHLPRSSYFIEAVLADPDYADAIADQELPDAKERVAEWTPEREGIAQLIDAVHENTQILVALAGGTARPPRPVTRPETVLDDARARNQQRRYEQLLARILGAPTADSEPE